VHTRYLELATHDTYNQEQFLTKKGECVVRTTSDTLSCIKLERRGSWR
jgi:hypothetical protein